MTQAIRMIGFDPDALARLLTRWKGRRLDRDSTVATLWTQAVRELSLVIAVSPQQDATPRRAGTVRK
jgi:hypothetical protein